MDSLTATGTPAARLGLVCGIDLGSKHDHSAIVLLEIEKRLKAKQIERLGLHKDDKSLHDQIVAAGNYKGQAILTEKHFLARHIKRLPLGVTYPDVVRYLRQLDDQVFARLAAEGAAKRSVVYVVDGTGLGQPVVNYLGQEIDKDRIKAV
jgi:hypothetical protein